MTPVKNKIRVDLIYIESCPFCKHKFDDKMSHRCNKSDKLLEDLNRMALNRIEQ